MNKKLKRYLVGIFFALLLSILPAKVFAISLAEQAYQDNNYETLVQVFDQEQIVKKCITNNEDHYKDAIYGYSNKNSDESGDFADILTLSKDALIKTHDWGGDWGEIVHSNYLALESSSGNPEQGYFECGELGVNPFDVLFNNLNSRFSSQVYDPVGDFICGKDNRNGGWISMTLEINDWGWKTYKSEEYSDKGYPSWMDTDSEGHFKNCKQARTNILSLFGPGFNYDNFRVKLKKRDGFSVDNYFSEALGLEGDNNNEPKVVVSGDSSVIKSGLENASKYMNFTAGCGVEAVDQQAVNNGSGYKIYYNGQTKYFKVTKPDQKVYTNINDRNVLTCKEVAEALSNSDAELEFNKRAIERCYETAQVGVEDIEKLILKLKLYSGDDYAGRLIEVANYVAKGEADKINPSVLSYAIPTIGAPYNNGALGYGANIYNAINNDSQLSGIKAFGNLAKELDDLTNEYYYKETSGKTLSDEEKTAIGNKIKNFETARNEITNEENGIIKKIEDLSGEIPTVDKISMYEPCSNNEGLGSWLLSSATCYHPDVINNEVENFYKVDDDGKITCIYNDKVQEVAGKIKALGFDIETEEYSQYTPADDDDTSKESNCYDAGIEGMSWILCPVVNNTSQAVDGIGGILRDWLSIKEDQLFNDDVYVGWNIFRNIANSLLIIVLLVVIFSQLTGMGIDNYGIKKILPRLIMMGILINLSYIICQLAVELSNILGVGLDNMMRAIGTSIAGTRDLEEGLGAYEVVGVLFGVLAGAGAIAGVAVGSGGGVMLVISLVLALLMALVAVLIFFMMLGARMVIVAVFTVIAPVAFACYILPGTQGLFKKWWKIFEAALVVFPICGALYGASYIIKAIVGGSITGNSGTDDPLIFFHGLTAVIAPFLPFLILPTLLKGAMAGLGALGGVFATLGGGLRKGLSSGGQAIQKSERLQDSNTRWMAGYKKDGTTKKDLNGFQRFLRGGRRSVQSNALRYQKVQSERGAREATEGEDFMLATATANKAKYIEASGEINDNGRLQAGLQRALRDKDRAAIRAYTDALSSKGENGREIVGKVWNDYTADSDKMSAVSAKTFADNIMANHSMEYKNNDRAMFDIAKNINNVEGRRQDDKGNYTESQDSYDRRIKNAVQSRANYVATQKAKLTESVSANTIGTMDDYAFDELFDSNSGTGDKDLGKIVYEAIHGANAANIKEKRMKTLRSILKNSEYTPDVQNVRVVKDGES